MSEINFTFIQKVQYPLTSQYNSQLGLDVTKLAANLPECARQMTALMNQRQLLEEKLISLPLETNTMIHFICPSCDKALKVENDRAGQKANCPACGTAVRIPRTQEILSDALELSPNNPSHLEPPIREPLPPTVSPLETAKSWLGAAGQLMPPMAVISQSVEPYLPAIQKFAREKSRQVVADFVRNDDCMSAVLNAAYEAVLPFPVRVVVPKKIFITFGLSQRDRIFGPE